MSDLVCFNCQLPGHKSANCPDAQKRSRCPSCDKVNGHARDCQNTQFNSESRFKSTTVFAMQKILKVDFQQVTGDFFIQDVKNNVPIGSIPLWISTIDVFVGKIGNSLEFAASRPTKRHITFLNDKNQPALSLVFTENKLIVNDRFTLDEKGVISYNCNAENTITEKLVCRIGIQNTEQVFKVRINWHGHKHVFHVYPVIGPVSIDPQQPIKIQQPNPATIDNKIALNVVFNQQGANDENEGAIGGLLPQDRVYTVHLDLPGLNRSMVNDEFMVNLLRKTIANLQTEQPTERRAIDDNKENRSQ